MDLEIFDESYTFQAKLVIDIYKNDETTLPNWWLEISDSDEFEAKDLLAITSCFNSIERQIDAIVKASM